MLLLLLRCSLSGTKGVYLVGRYRRAGMAPNLDRCYHPKLGDAACLVIRPALLRCSRTPLVRAVVAPPGGAN